MHRPAGLIALAISMVVALAAALLWSSVRRSSSDVPVSFWTIPSQGEPTRINGVRTFASQPAICSSAAGPPSSFAGSLEFTWCIVPSVPDGPAIQALEPLGTLAMVRLRLRGSVRRSVLAVYGPTRDVREVAGERWVRYRLLPARLGTQEPR